MVWGRGNPHHDEDNNSDDNESENRKDKKPKSRKPPNTAFRQQRLLAYAPILTPKTVLPLFFAIGIIFGPIGGLLLYASSKVCHPVSHSSPLISLTPDRSKRSPSITHIVHKWQMAQIS